LSRFVASLSVDLHSVMDPAHGIPLGLVWQQMTEAHSTISRIAMALAGAPIVCRCGEWHWKRQLDPNAACFIPRVAEREQIGAGATYVKEPGPPWSVVTKGARSSAITPPKWSVGSRFDVLSEDDSDFYDACDTAASAMAEAQPADEDKEVVCDVYCEKNVVKKVRRKHVVLPKINVEHVGVSAVNVLGKPGKHGGKCGGVFEVSSPCDPVGQVVAELASSGTLTFTTSAVDRAEAPHRASVADDDFSLEDKEHEVPALDLTDRSAVMLATREFLVTDGRDAACAFLDSIDARIQSVEQLDQLSAWAEESVELALLEDWHSEVPWITFG
jgi:hypothetical protein